MSAGVARYVDVRPVRDDASILTLAARLASVFGVEGPLPDASGSRGEQRLVVGAADGARWELRRYRGIVDPYAGGVEVGDELRLVGVEGVAFCASVEELAWVGCEARVSVEGEAGIVAAVRAVAAAWWEEEEKGHP